MDIQKLPEVVGSNCRRIRQQHGVSQTQLASHARRLGLKWTASKVGDFESGRSAPQLSTVLTLVLALDNAIGQGLSVRERPRVVLADLMQTDGYVSLTDDFAPVGSAVAAVCSGKRWELHGGETAETADVEALLEPAPGVFGEYGMRVGDVADMRKRSDVTERRLARKLGIDPDLLLALSWHCWRRTFSEERDHRAVRMLGNRRGAYMLAEQDLKNELRTREENSRGNL
jgi:transcriptional regulator with XRE-family HTH domain